MYHPRVFGIMVGQPLEIENSDPLLHNIKAMGKAFECNVHGWMHAYAGVLPYRFFSTTGTDGRFTIEHLPPGTYAIEAWHERYGTKNRQGDRAKQRDEDA
jgi:hypothetical protein